MSREVLVAAKGATAEGQRDDRLVASRLARRAGVGDLRRAHADPDAPFLAAFAFYGWVAVYILAPVLVGALWLRNRRTDPRRPEAGDALLSLDERWSSWRLLLQTFLVATVFMLVAPRGRGTTSTRIG